MDPDSIFTTGRDAPATRTSSPVTVRVGAVPDLTTRARRSERSQEIVITPVRQHQRNLRLQLREENCAESAFDFLRPVDLARQVLGAANYGTEVLDRLDRLQIVEDILRDAHQKGSVWYADLVVAAGLDLIERSERVEQLRSEIETVTGFHPDRLDTLQSLGDNLEPPTDTESLAVIAGARAVHARLKEQADVAVSSDALLRQATRSLSATRVSWRDAYPSITRVTFAGMSSLSVSVADLLHTIGRITDVDVQIYLRGATGRRVRHQLNAHERVDKPGLEVFDR